MKPYKHDIAVLILFFCRHEQLNKVFEQIKLARPSRLYFYQDGPREGREDDKIGIHKCQEIVDDSQIDWECQIHRFYQKKNMGCDPSEYIAQKWMFETEEMGIILEDDDVPSQSFFPFCKELLEKYKDDTRINMVCGMNNTGISSHINNSYLFTRKGSIWGWASWKRVLDTWDEHYSWLDDPDKLAIISSQISREEYDSFIKTAIAHKDTNRAHYESINAAAVYLGKRLNIVPKYNMICNIGISSESTHSVSDIRLLPKRTQRFLSMKTYEIDFPLIHPKEIKIDKIFERKFHVNLIERIYNIIESCIRSLLYQGISGFLKRLKKKISHAK